MKQRLLFNISMSLIRILYINQDYTSCLFAHCYLYYFWFKKYHKGNFIKDFYVNTFKILTFR